MIRSSPGRAPSESRRAEAASRPDQDDVRIGSVFHGVLDDVRNHPLQHAGVGVDLRHVGRQVHPHPARGDGAQGTRDDLVPAHGLEQGIDGIRRDPGHVQQVAHQRVQPVRTLLDRCQQFLFLFLGVMDVVVAQPADGKLDPGQRGAQVVGDCAEDGGAHRVAFGQAQHLPPAGHQLLAFQLGRQMNTERRRGAAGRWPAESVRRAPGAWRRRFLRRCRRWHRPLARRRAGPEFLPRRPEVATRRSGRWRRCRRPRGRSQG